MGGRDLPSRHEQVRYALTLCVGQRWELGDDARDVLAHLLALSRARSALAVAVAG
jgi:hypothetical protein